jgi:Leucine-rich repeat (LRR) protein
LSVVFSAGGELAAQESDSLSWKTTRLFKSLEQASANPDSVFRLDLSNLKTRKFPPEVFQYKNLRYLNMSRNKIKEIPKEIARLIHLEVLVLNRNIIEVIPPELAALSNLVVLELWDNEISFFPDEMKNLKNLRKLELRGILFTPEEQNRILSLMPEECRVYMSPPCNCQ